MPAEFQTQFAQTLLDTGVANTSGSSRTPAALSVYRNTVMKGWVDALAANFPSVQRLVGEEWFAGAASCFARECPPSNPVLAWYGAGFADFIERFPPAHELPYLADVARLDRMWNEAYFAADTTSLSANELQALDQAHLFAATLQLHPATHFGVFQLSAVSIWKRNHPSFVKDASTDTLEIDDTVEAALFTRPKTTVQVFVVNVSELSFLSYLLSQTSLGAAATATLDSDPQFPLAATLAKFIKAGVFTAIDLPNKP